MKKRGGWTGRKENSIRCQKEAAQNHPAGHAKYVESSEAKPESISHFGFLSLIYLQLTEIDIYVY